MKPTILVLVLMSLMSNIFSQNTGAIKLIVLPAKVNSDSIEVIVQVKNVSDASLIFYKPYLDLVNFHIINITAYREKPKDSVNYWSDNSQLDRIEAHRKNYDLLKPGDEKQYFFPLDRKLFYSKRSDKKFKKISVEIDYANSEIVCMDCDLPPFHGSLKADNVILYE